MRLVPPSRQGRAPQRGCPAGTPRACAPKLAGRDACARSWQAGGGGKCGPLNHETPRPLAHAALFEGRKHSRLGTDRARDRPPDEIFEQVIQLAPLHRELAAGERATLSGETGFVSNRCSRQEACVS